MFVSYYEYYSGGRKMSNVYIMDHPLIQHKLGIMRRKTTSTKEFRDLVSEVAMLICYEATRKLPLTDIEIETPLMSTVAKEIEGKKLCIVPILRAGLHMADGILNLIPNAKVGHIGLYRNETTLEPVEYFCKLPSDAAEREIYVVDPMLATGGSAVAAINLLKKRGITKICFLCLIAAPEGVSRLTKEHPDVDVYIGSLDERLNENGYILPGLGDAGDRIYGTK
jgi:uracil phosphoribosyltransferase